MILDEKKRRRVYEKIQNPEPLPQDLTPIATRIIDDPHSASLDDLTSIRACVWMITGHTTNGLTPRQLGTLHRELGSPSLREATIALRRRTAGRHR